MRGWAALAAAILLAAGCSDAGKPGLDFPPTRAETPTRDPTPPPIDRSPGSAAAAMEALCRPPAFPSPSPVRPTEDLEPELAQLAGRVEAVRELEYVDPLAVEAVGGQEMRRRVAETFAIQYPKDLYARRTRAWTTIGVLPEGADLREALLSFGEGGIVGYYDPATGELVYIGSGDLGFNETFTLAHELTHALDDQHFDLARIDALVNGCRDEAFLAALGAVEGSAQFFATRLIREFPVLPGGDDIGAGDLAALDDVPPFLLALQLWPYNYGHGFIIALERRGGVSLVNRALRRFPLSTEQILHPERYPNDVPRAVDVPPLGSPGWKDLDVMQVGEEWLRSMLTLRVDGPTANGAAAGWDGGTYRAFVNGRRVVVVVRTVWDSAGDAQQFQEALQLWIGEGNGHAAVRREGDAGTVAFFATDGDALEVARSAF